MCSLSVRHCSCVQSAGTFEEVEKPSAAYQKTRPVEAGQEKRSRWGVRY